MRALIDDICLNLSPGDESSIHACPSQVTAALPMPDILVRKIQIYLNKLASLKATLMTDQVADLLTGVKCRTTSVAKKFT